MWLDLHLGKLSESIISIELVPGDTKVWNNNFFKINLIDT